MKYIIHGSPIPRKNPALNKRFCSLYDPQKLEKETYRYNLKFQHGNKPFIEPPISVTFNIFIKMPSSWSEKKKDSHRGKLHTSKPDYSNCLKFIEDCATGIIYKDDCQLALFREARKIWADEDKTEFTLEHVDEKTEVA